MVCKDIVDILRSSVSGLLNFVIVLDITNIR